MSEAQELLQMQEGEMMKLTQEKRARIYCAVHGHANYVINCFGYVHCGRCGDQIGDRLGGVFDMSNKIAVGCKDQSCGICDPLVKKLLPFDKIIYDRLKKDASPNQESLLKGVKIPAVKT